MAQPSKKWPEPPPVTDVIPDVGRELRELRAVFSWSVQCREDYPEELCIAPEELPCCLRHAFACDGKEAPSVASIRGWELGSHVPGLHMNYRIHMLFERMLFKGWRARALREGS